MSEPAQGWVQTVPTLLEAQPYEKIVRLTVPWQKGRGNLPPPFPTAQPYERIVRLELTGRPSTGDKKSRLDHFEDMLEMVSTEFLLYQTEDRQTRGQRQQQSGFVSLGRNSGRAAKQAGGGEEGMNCLAAPTIKRYLKVRPYATSSAVLANSATTAPVATLAKNARVGRAAGSLAVVKRNLTTGSRCNRQELLDSSNQPAR